MNKFINKNYKYLIPFILVITITGIVTHAEEIVISSKSVGYTNSNLDVDNVSDAIDKLYEKTKLSKQGNFIEAYKYNESTCVTGEEDTCVRSTCYKDTTKGACNAGNIIKYKVRDSEVVTFHVMYNDASTITMQAQKNTVYNTAWITALDYSGSTTYKNDKGPLTILTALESATAGWSNVNDITYFNQFRILWM